MPGAFQKRSTRVQRGAKTQYAEILTSPVWLRIAVYIFFGSLIAFYLFSPFWSDESNDILNLTLCLVFSFVLWLLHVFLSLRVSLSDKGIHFGFALFAKDIPYEQILDCRVARNEGIDYLAWGVRTDADGASVYSVPGVPRRAFRILVKEGDERATYVVSSKRPEVICGKVLRKMVEGRPNGP